jgi:2-polyprenyl-3-methyl-5-hydroxy-6-metoxy-1,4-benzoquinol methylase
MQFHPESPDLRNEDLSRLRFVTDLKKHLYMKSGPENRRIYEERVARAGDKTIVSENEAAVRREEIRLSMEKEPYFQAWSSALRSSQDLMWEYVGKVVDSDMDRLTDRFETAKKADSVAVRTDPDMPIPNYIASSDTHRMPGSYQADLKPNDVRAGAIYDLGAAIYQLGLGNASGALLNDTRGRTLVAFLKQYYPDFAPKRILDMGCAAGHNTIPLCRAYPDAEMQAIDIGAAMVRYASLRAQGLGFKAHFSQQNAECTDFEDGSFDLVVSQIILHETSPDATARIVAESHRLLKRGGIAVHLEVPVRYDHLDIFDQFFISWEQYYNDEPNITGVAIEDFGALAARTGFTDIQTGFYKIPQADDPSVDLSKTPLKGCWYIVSGTRP